jgi:quercetin dioxygenase-like cupin family protein
VFEKPRAVPEHLQGRGREPSRRSLGPFSRSGDDGLGRWRHAWRRPSGRPGSLAAGGNHPGARWRLDGEDLQANLVRLDQGDRIAPHRNDEVGVLVVVVFGRGELALDGQVHQLAPMVIAHLPKGTVRAIEAVDGPLAYLSVHRRRPAGLQVGRHAQRRWDTNGQAAREASGLPIHPL